MLTITEYLKLSVQKITKQSFDDNEIQEYTVMAIDEYISWNKTLDVLKFKKWLKYKSIQYAFQALSVNSCKKEYEKKATFYRSKTAKFFETKDSVGDKK